MSDAENARQYLKDVLADVPGGLNAASRRIGKNHAYLQQYIRRGKPLWLSEAVRNALVRAYGIDGDKLKPPPVRLRAVRGPAQSRGDSDNQREIDIPGFGQLANESSQFELLEIWDRIDPARRELALRILRAMADAAQPIIAERNR